MKKNVLHFGIIAVSQFDNIFNYMIKYLGDKGNDEILIERRLYSKLEEVLK